MVILKRGMFLWVTIMHEIKWKCRRRNQQFCMNAGFYGKGGVWRVIGGDEWRIRTRGDE